jgi:hypothetical protein
MFQVMAWFTCFIWKLLRHSTAFNIQPFNGRNGCTALYHPIRLVLQCKKRFQMLPVQFNHQHVAINVRNVQSAMQQTVSFLFLATSLLNVTSTRDFILPSVHFPFYFPFVSFRMLSVSLIFKGIVSRNKTSIFVQVDSCCTGSTGPPRCSMPSCGPSTWDCYNPMARINCQSCDCCCIEIHVKRSQPSITVQP